LTVQPISLFKRKLFKAHHFGDIPQYPPTQSS